MTFKCEFWKVRKQTLFLLQIRSKTEVHFLLLRKKIELCKTAVISISSTLKADESVICRSEQQLNKCIQRVWKRKGTMCYLHHVAALEEKQKCPSTLDLSVHYLPHRRPFFWVDDLMFLTCYLLLHSSSLPSLFFSPFIPGEAAKNIFSQTVKSGGENQRLRSQSCLQSGAVCVCVCV